MSNNITSKHLRRRCLDCNQVFPVLREGDPLLDIPSGYASWYERRVGYVMWISDPYMEEIYGDFSKRWLCGNCAAEGSWDI